MLVGCLALKNIKSEHWNQDWFWILRLDRTPLPFGEHSGRRWTSASPNGKEAFYLHTHLLPQKECSSSPSASTRPRRASPRYALSTSPLWLMINFQAPVGVHVDVHVCSFYPYKWQLQIWYYYYIGFRFYEDQINFLKYKKILRMHIIFWPCY